MSIELEAKAFMESNVYKHVMQMLVERTMADMSLADKADAGLAQALVIKFQTIQDFEDEVSELAHEGVRQLMDEQSSDS